MQEAVDEVTGTSVAVKIFKKRKMSMKDLCMAYTEYNLMKQTNHDSILAPLMYFECTRYICIVYELLASDLRALLSEFSQSLNED